MKPSTPHSGKSGRDFVKRLRACLPQAKRKTHRLSANVTGEEDWEVDEPQIRMSRAFAVMLILHLVAVGGLFAFHVFGKDDREAEGIATRQAHEKSTPPPAAVTSAPVPAAPVIPRAEIVLDEPPAPPGEQQHILKAGESKSLIAAKYGITVSELEEANIHNGFNAGDKLVIPPPVRVISAVQAAPPVKPPVALIAATPSEEVGHQDFALKEGPENPYAPVEPAELEAAAPAPAPAAPRAKLVKAEPAPAVRAVPQAEEVEDAATPPARKKAAAAPAPVAAAKPKPATGSRSHVIGKGDTIYNVAKRYGISPNEVMRANGISDPSRLQMGQVLKITVKR